ncbi:hypothetical protein [Flavobacterium humi]|uniref:HEAT repeat domain-containing protein n=1 Tax=Flavobacterium humi TaxID=2562683 RepID=A0A4Z0L671_9FLAO|nr:hypothetical protein [Flavobacterium humi]TGD57061.1 hypothetical protein E4635_12895 [Flavobacterium humi]
METIFFKRIDSSNASTNCRNGLRDFILQHPEYLGELCAIALDIQYKNHYKGVWILEMIAEKQTELLSDYVDHICSSFVSIKNDSAIRGISRVAFFLGTTTKITLTETQEEKIIEICLDWLIRDERVACKVYAMKTLHHLSRKHPWIKDELHLIIDKDYAEQSAAYKAAAREVLKKKQRS